MESSVSTIDALIRPWRTATIVAGVIAAVELVALLAIGAVFLGPAALDWATAKDGTAATAARPQRAETAVVKKVATPPAAVIERSRPLLPRTETSVLVLNGNGIQGAAAAEADAVRARGYVIAGVGNAPRADYRRSLVMYRPGHRQEAFRLSRDLGVARVSPLDGLRRGQLMGAQVAVVIGAR